MNWLDWFYYDETSPTALRWKVRRGQRGKIDGVAGYRCGKYYRVQVDGRGYLTSRVLWEMTQYEIPDGYIIDHIDGNPSNNLLSNLRCIEEGMNARNCRKRRDNKTGMTGICERVIDGIRYYAAQWMLEGKVYGKYINRDKLGDEEALRLAIEARDNAIHKLNKMGAGYTDRHGI